MSKVNFAITQLADLRLRAAQRLGHASSPAETAVKGFDALAVLHELASSPDTAVDALALLHELQVYQVELELQAEELRDSRLELEAELRRLVARYDHQPVACVSIDRELVIHELNLAAARALGVVREEACGLLLDGFVSLQGRKTLRGLIDRLERGMPLPESALQLKPRTGKSKTFRVAINVVPGEPIFLLVFCEDPAQGLAP